MSTLLAKVLPLGFGAAVSPTLFAAVVMLLSQPSRPRARAAAFAAGAALPLVGIAVVGLAVFRQAGANGHLRISPVVDVFFGLVLLLLALRIALKADADDKRQERPFHAGLFACGLLGSGLMITNFSSLALFIPAVKEVAVTPSIGWGSRLLVTVLLLGIVLMTVWLPMLLYTVAPKQAQAVLAPVMRTTRRHSQLIGIVVCSMFGVYLCAKGITKL